jgi:hypothetical protein
VREDHGSGELTGEIFGRGLGMTPGPHLSVREGGKGGNGSGGKPGWAVG